MDCNCEHCKTEIAKLRKEVDDRRAAIESMSTASIREKHEQKREIMRDIENEWR